MSISTKKISLFLIFIFMLNFCINMTVKALETNSTPVTFADAGLEKSIRATLQKTTGDITISDMESLTSISLYENNITNLSGLEYAVNLTYFLSYFNNIQDLSPLSNLTKLNTLSITNDKSRVINSLDTTVLNKLTNLTSLKLRNFSIKDVTPISNLINLESVYLEDNLIEDITPLSNLKNLKELSVFYNKISDISSINKFKSLKKLDLNNNIIKDIQPLVDFVSSGHTFNMLDILNNYIDVSNGSEEFSKINILKSSCPSFYFNTQKIWFNDDRLRAKVAKALVFSSTATLDNRDVLPLTELNLDDSGISDLTGLQYMSGLLKLSLNNTKVTSLKQLKNLKNLTYLSAESNYIDDISSLQNSTNLQYLNLSDNYISNIDSLSNKTELKVLGLHSNLISDLSPLQSLNKLQVLDLGFNSIKEAKSISNLTNMTMLSLAYNSISDLSPLKNMTKLQVLELQDNNISNISVLNTLKSSGAFKTNSAINLSYNYLDLSTNSQQKAYAANLQAGGTNVITTNQFSNATPRVILSNPENGTTGFSTNLPITIYSNKSLVAGDYINTISIVGDANKIISCSVNIDNDKVTITPNEKLENNKRYILQIPIGAFKSKTDGSVNDDYISIFTTTPYIENTYTVNFNSVGGSSTTSQTVSSDSTLTAPAAPTKTGYTFAGWYKEASYITPWNFSTDKVTSDTTLYAKWTLSKPISVSYQGHVQNIGWQNYVSDGALSGTSGKSLRVEGFRIKLVNAPAGLNVKYKAHVQNIGWQNWVYNNSLAGTFGKSLRIEAVRIVIVKKTP